MKGQNNYPNHQCKEHRNSGTVDTNEADNNLVIFDEKCSARRRAGLDHYLDICIRTHKYDQQGKHKLFISSLCPKRVDRFQTVSLEIFEDHYTFAFSNNTLYVLEMNDSDETTICNYKITLY